MAINFVTGDATLPIGDGIKVIVHIVNNRGAWGAGFVLALSKRFGGVPATKYKQWYTRKRDSDFPEFILGEVMLVRVNDSTIIANLLAQDGFSTASVPAVSLAALEASVRNLNCQLDQVGGEVSVHMPRIGTGLGGRSWDEVLPIVSMINREVFVYDLR